MKIDPMENKISGALGRGLKIIDVLRSSGRPVSSAEISQICQFDASTTHRLLQTLREHQYVIRDDKKKLYFASPKLLFPLSVYSPLNEFRREATRTANQIRDESGQTAGFVLFCMNERILIEIAVGQYSLSPVYETWLDSPIHASASGKVLLLSMNEEERSQLLGPGPFQAHTKYTITDPIELDKDLAVWAQKGYAVANNDYFDGLFALGAPIWASSGACIGCIFVNGRSADINDKQLDELGLALKSAAKLFSMGTPAVQAVTGMFDANPLPSRSNK